MTTAEFANLVQEKFDFLKRSYAFTSSPTCGYSVRFDSYRVFVVVVYDATRSYELGLQVGLQAGLQHDVERPFEISEMLRVAGEVEAAEQTAAIHARTSDLDSKLEWLANLLRVHGSCFLSGNLTRFEMLDRQRDADCAEYALDRDLAYAREDAQNAWDRGRYEEVVEKLVPFQNRLTQSEQKRLRIAQMRSNE